MNLSELAYTVRDNAIHGWRTINEIAADEGLSVEEVNSACESYLLPSDMEEVHRMQRVADFAAA